MKNRLRRWLRERVKNWRDYKKYQDAMMAIWMIYIQKDFFCGMTDAQFETWMKNHPSITITAVLWQRLEILSNLFLGLVFGEWWSFDQVYCEWLESYSIEEDK